MSDHTPTPWRIKNNGENTYHGGDDLFEIVTTHPAPERTYFPCVADNEPYYPQAVTRVDAELIVKAVNQHEALRKALAEVIEYAKDLASEADRFGYPPAITNAEKILDN